MDMIEELIKPQMDTDDIDRLTQKILGCAYKVSNVLGAGFLEKVYENAFAYELRKAGLRIKQQYRIEVLYGDILHVHTR
jgi:GxxExxY protein